jgi:protein TonB
MKYWCVLLLCFTISAALGQEDSSLSRNDSKIITTAVTMLPSFPGGAQAFFRFISHNLKYPGKARDNNTQGSVTISFVVEKDGTISDVKVETGLGDGCDEEALRIIKLSPRWIPGKQNGRAVRVTYSVPVKFTLDN